MAASIISNIEDEVWKAKTEKKIQLNVPQNILKVSQHSFESFVYMNTVSLTQGEKIQSNDENKQTIVEPSANNRIRSLRIKTQVVNETTKHSQEDKWLRKTKRLDSLRTKSKMKTNLS